MTVNITDLNLKINIIYEVFKEVTRMVLGSHLFHKRKFI